MIHGSKNPFTTAEKARMIIFLICNAVIYCVSLGGLYSYYEGPEIIRSVTWQHEMIDELVMLLIVSGPYTFLFGFGAVMAEIKVDIKWIVNSLACVKWYLRLYFVACIILAVISLFEIFADPIQHRQWINGGWLSYNDFTFYLLWSLLAPIYLEGMNLQLHNLLKNKQWHLNNLQKQNEKNRIFVQRFKSSVRGLFYRKDVKNNGPQKNPNSIPSELQELAKLWNDDLITDEEYRQAKHKLLKD